MDNNTTELHIYVLYPLCMYAQNKSALYSISFGQLALCKDTKVCSVHMIGLRLRLYHVITSRVPINKSIRPRNEVIMMNNDETYDEIMM